MIPIGIRRERTANGKAAGFSMAELLILVAIIGILAVLGISTYLHFRRKAITVEAKMALNNIYKLETSHYEDNGVYIADLEALGFTMVGNPRYDYEIIGADTTGFSARALANLDGDPVLDIWTINQAADLVQVSRD